MHLGILSARTAQYHPNRRLMEAGGQMGHRVSLIHPGRCLSGIGPMGLDLCLPTRAEPLDILLPRIGATISDFALILVRHFELTSTLVVNPFASILLARNKFLSLQTLAAQGLPVPDSHYITNFKSFEQSVSKLGGYPVVAKVPNGRQGEGVVLVESDVTAGFIVHNLLDKRGGLLVQEFLSTEERRDLRAFVLGDEVIGAMELTPRRGDFRANIHLKGAGRSVNLPQELSDLAIRSTRALGLEISGTDILMAGGRPKVVEVNYSPGFKVLEAATGQDIASRVIAYLVNTYGRGP